MTRRRPLTRFLLPLCLCGPVVGQEQEVVGQEPASPHRGPAPTPPARAATDARWCFQPPVDVAPPAVDDPRFAADPIDRFVRARLATAGLEPAPPAAPATWLRRVSFDLIGLPPTPAEIEAFVADPSPAARAAAVDRLLAAPQFGERWARHWMDLFRYAESMGHEFDFSIVGAWRYRDWLIRSLNDDLPYDRFIVEHLAGDLLDDPRIDPDTHLPISAIGTTGLLLGDQTHSPVDTKQADSDRIDNVLDIVSKSFLGVTLACARCHDHKFDPIPTTDYYAAYGVFASATSVNHVLEPVGSDALHTRLGAASDALRQAALHALADSGAQGAERALRAALDVLGMPVEAEGDAKARKERFEALADQAAARHGAEAAAVRELVARLRDPAAAREQNHPLHALAVLRGASGAEIAERWSEVTGSNGTARQNDRVVADAADPSARDWHRDGPAFLDAPMIDGVLVVADGDDTATLSAWPGSFVHSARRSPRECGTLSTPDFRIDRRYLYVWAAGRASRINVVLDGFRLVRGPIYDAYKQELQSDSPRWIRIDLEPTPGRRASLELVDVSAPDPADPMHDGGWEPRGWLAFGRAVLSDDPNPPPEPVRAAITWLGREPPADVDALIGRYVDALRRGDPAALAAFAGTRVARITDASLASVCKTWRDAEAALPEPAFVTTLTEGDDVVEPVHVRGGHRNAGPLCEHRGLTVLGAHAAEGRGHGRLAFAQQIASADNPLTARVAVNLIWYHLLGRGLVPTVDNFGKLGEEPSHRELLDWLALRFVEDGWSLKKAVRRIVLSETYGMASRHEDAEMTARAELVDPDNHLLHRANLRRLEGEVIRDAMLALSGRLDPKMGGPSVAVHLTPFMDGRGRPGASGPADGDGRRSVYLEVRRNFLDPFFLAFDTPIPFSTVGVRSVSNVPGQALALLNDPFTVEQAAKWAARARGSAGDIDAAIDAMYLAAFARHPTADERASARSFLGDGSDTASWDEFAHVLFNVKDFVFLE